MTWPEDPLPFPRGPAVPLILFATFLDYLGDPLSWPKPELFSAFAFDFWINFTLRRPSRETDLLWIPAAIFDIPAIWLWTEFLFAGKAIPFDSLIWFFFRFILIILGAPVVFVPPDGAGLAVTWDLSTAKLLLLSVLFWSSLYFLPAPTPTPFPFPALSALKEGSVPITFPETIIVLLRCDVLR